MQHGQRTAPCAMRCVAFPCAAACDLTAPCAARWHSAARYGRFCFLYMSRRRLLKASPLAP
eukprot:2572808-Pyramimonas_sp.AAC.1